MKQIHKHCWKITLSSHSWNAIRIIYMQNTHAAVWQRVAERHKAFCCRSTAVVRGKVYLKLSSGQCNSGQFVKDCLHDRIPVTTFYQICYDVQTNESKESVLDGILKLILKIRIATISRKLEYRNKKHVSKNKKASELIRRKTSGENSS